MAETKYGKYIMREPKAGTPESRVPLHVDWTLNKGIGCDFAFIGFDDAHETKHPPHKHPVDEFLYFLGGNPTNIMDFGAEIDLTLGEGEDKEVHTITNTSVVYIPAGLVHMPMFFKKVTKPILCGHLLMSPGYIETRI
jgi:hypothetical protein